MLTKERRKKWKYVFIALAANYITVPIVFLFMSLDNPNIVQNFKYAKLSYFLPISQFYDFINNEAYLTVIKEEIETRGPAWLLINCNIKYGAIFALIVMLIRTYFWALQHDQIIFPSVFIAGFVWGLAVIKTKSLWPAVVCHSAANISLYFLIKILQYFQVIT